MGSPATSDRRTFLKSLGLAATGAAVVAVPALRAAASEPDADGLERGDGVIAYAGGDPGVVDIVTHLAGLGFVENADDSASAEVAVPRGNLTVAQGVLHHSTEDMIAVLIAVTEPAAHRHAEAHVWARAGDGYEFGGALRATAAGFELVQ